ncbi:uncharacterized protein LOC134468286 [Engraulis encrasicolus]|uniref:uncharacterized protein LOC134468286 n=1 Tax=Engraulis encrasicolus TaxID=184585 RepID=UPI002FD78182
MCIGLWWNCTTSSSGSFSHLLLIRAKARASGHGTRAMAGQGVSFAGSLLLVLTCLSWTLSSAQYTAKTAVLDDDVALTCNTFCQGPRTWTDLDGNEVAHCEVDGRCRSADENIKMSNDSKDGKQSLDLVISPVHFNNQGFYLGTCDGHYCDKKLQVLAPQRVIVHTGENITLPCHAITKKNEMDQNIYGLWEKNGEMGVKLDGGVLTHGVIPMDRGLISRDGYKRGDLSLSLSFVRPSDAGLYQCHYSPRRDTDNFQGAPNSVVLEVLVSTFQVQDDAPVTVPVISDGPVAVTFKGHDGGPEDEVCTLSEGLPQCNPQHGGMFAMQDGKLTFTRGISTRGEVYVLKDVNKGYVIYRFNVTRAAKELLSG